MNTRVAALGVVLGVALAACGADGGADRAAGSTAQSSSAAESGGGTTSSGATTTARAAQAKRGVRLVRIGGFNTPVYVTAPPGDSRRLMVVEQTGRIMVVRGGRKLATPFLDIRSRVTYGGEQGLLSVAFPPDYQRSGRFYVYYTSGAHEPDRRVPAGERGPRERLDRARRARRCRTSSRTTTAG